MQMAWQDLWAVYQRQSRPTVLLPALLQRASWGDRGLLLLLVLVLLMCLWAFLGGAHTALFGILALLALSGWMLRITWVHQQQEGNPAPPREDPRYGRFRSALQEVGITPAQVEALLPTTRLHLVQGRVRSRHGFQMLAGAVSLLLVLLGLASADSLAAGLSHAFVLWLMVALPLIYLCNDMTHPVRPLEEMERFMQLYCEDSAHPG